VGPRNHVLHGDQGQTNPFAAARGDKMAMLPFVKIL